MSGRHLGPALVACGVFAAMAVGFTVYARGIERRSVHAQAAAWFHQKSLGNALQREAFRQDDLLVVFGASELTSGGAFNADRFFADYPSGFDVFRVGWPGFTPLVTTAMQIAGNGATVRGEKVVLSLSPSLFWRPTDAELARYYAGNFSRLQANELAFSTEVSSALKQRIARRLLAYPAPLAADPVLRVALELLASGRAAGRLAQATLYPLGVIRLAAMRLDDHWETLAWLRAHPASKSPEARRPRAIDWPKVIAAAAASYEAASSHNPLGVDDEWWKANGENVLRQKGRHPDKQLASELKDSPQWAELEMLLDVLHEFGAEPLILSAPMKGAYYEFVGATPETRKRLYYDRLRAVAAAHGAALASFEDHDGDIRFTADTGDHPSPKGWAFYDQAMDAFYHGTLR